MIKFTELKNIDDGRQDMIIMAHDGKEQLVIRQEMYEYYGVTYEEIKDTKNLSAFLIFIGLQIAKGIQE
jgi:ribosomal protein L7Ae-like RNA K-turn-binding protein